MKKALILLLLCFAAAAFAAEFRFDGEDSVFFKEQRWKKGGDDAAGIMEIVDATDHAAGGKALKITLKDGLAKFDRLRVQTRLLPFEAGKIYEVTGWFKGNAEGLAQVQLTSNWREDKKQWFQPVNFRVGPECRCIPAPDFISATATPCTDSSRTGMSRREK